jgi:membrane associated rhomboid family serine protease
MLEQLNNSLNLFINSSKENAPILAIILLIPWSVFFINALLGRRLLILGIIPRHPLGLFGIVFCPLLHAHFNHLFFNSIPLLVLSDFLILQGLDYFINVTIFITVVSGALIWCFAKSGIHIGASALITGYWGLLVMNIYQQGTFTAILLGLMSVYYFAGIFLGIFPSKKGVSWEGHLFGLAAGVAAAYAFA